MHHEQPALYEAIIAAPDEDAPRLLYADWLEEHGDLDRAEFIRLQIARWNAYPFVPDPYGREWQLLQQNRERWRAELPRLPGVDWGPFERGLVSWFIVRRREVFHIEARSIYETTPARALQFYLPEGHLHLVIELAQLLEYRELEMLEGFSLVRRGGVDCLLLWGRPTEMLVQGWRLSGLRRLVLERLFLHDELPEGLNAGPLRHQLTHLDLSNNPQLTAAGVGCFLDWARWPHLRYLNLRGCVGMRAAADDLRQVWGSVVALDL